LTHIRWTAQAFKDLQTISSYVERQRNLASANKVCRTIYDTIQNLRRFPELGKAGIEEGTRELIVSPLPSYIVVYRIAQPAAIQILRIWHGAQQRVE